jgi:hypothetical protein
VSRASVVIDPAPLSVQRAAEGEVIDFATLQLDVWRIFLMRLEGQLEAERIQGRFEAEQQREPRWRQIPAPSGVRINPYNTYLRVESRTAWRKTRGNSPRAAMRRTSSRQRRSSSRRRATRRAVAARDDPSEPEPPLRRHLDSAVAEQRRMTSCVVSGGWW